jgi:diketogulonate reductase-like aldo/keto reductase
MQNENVTVAGTDVPALGLGTWMLEGTTCATAVEQALELGYRHIDTAQMYENEHLVGAGLAASPVDRADVFLTTKLANDNLHPHRVHDSTYESLEKLATDWVDLLMVHWPVDMDGLKATLGAMRELQEADKVRHLGVCNFTDTQIETALDLAPLFAIQVEHHPYLAQPALLRTAQERNLLLTAYSPMARGDVLDDPVVLGIAGRLGTNPSAVVLRWLLDEPNVAAIPKASSRPHQEDNLAALGVELSDDDRSAIAALDKGLRKVDPPWAPAWES